MSNTQNILHDVEQAVEDYNNADTSNTFIGIEDIHPSVKPFKLMTRTCYVEFDPMSSRGKLPACLTRSVGPFIQNYVMLQDPKRNQIQVSIQKRRTKIYFTHGWSNLKDLYGIGSGGWITLLYISPLLFHMRVRKMTRAEVSYPETMPPRTLLLLEHPDNDSSGGPVPYFEPPRTFYHSIEKILTSSDITSTVLTLPWNGFCKHALPSKETELTFMDWLGYTWKCHLNFGDHKTCQISGQWRKLCKARGLMEGMTLKLSVTQPLDNTIVHFKVSPFIGVRTTLVAPRTAGGYKAFYQADHFFVL